MNHPPIIKNYQISTSGPTGDHFTLSKIYEDALPETKYPDIFVSLYDRLELLKLIRSSAFNDEDGHDISLKGTNKEGNVESVYQRFKLLELNPYNFGTTADPYANLPTGFLLYNMCYPIKYDKEIRCTNDSIAVNLRIYKLADNKYTMYNDNKMEDMEKDPVWCDIIMYDYIKRFILLTRTSPNFVCMYGFYIAQNAGIDFNTRQPTAITNATKAVVALTESPTYLLKDTSIISYQTNDGGNIEKMIRRGNVSPDVGDSLIFQLMSAYIAMMINGIKFVVDYHHNVFIKDVGTLVTTGRKYWRYKINNIDFYVPNMGNILMLDTRFRADEDSNFFKNPINEFGVLLKDYDYITNLNTVLDNVIHSFDKIKKTTVTHIIYTTRNLIREAEIKEDRNKQCGLIMEKIITTFGKYLHNRIGTSVRSIEKDYVGVGPLSIPKSGDFLIKKNANGNRTLVVFYEKSNDGKYRCIKKDIHDKHILEEIDPPNILSYNNPDQPLQDNITENDIIETYTMSFG